MKTYLRVLAIMIAFVFHMGVMSASAQTVLPSAENDVQVAGQNITTCLELKDAYKKAERGDGISYGDLEGQYLGLKIRCGSMTLGDLLYYAKYLLQFLFDILGTLAVIAVMRAGYIYMFSKDKESADGQKALRQVILGILVAVFSFAVVRLVFTFLFTFGG